jgi:hypothetical protein
LLSGPPRAILTDGGELPNPLRLTIVFVADPRDSYQREARARAVTPGAPVGPVHLRSEMSSA